MISSFDIHNLDLLLRDFYIAVGIRISIFDDAFRLVTEYPKEAPEFCSLIRESREGEEGCHACDEAAMKRAKKLRGPHIYTCHAGITEAVTPIQLGGGVLGYAILAHMLPLEDAKGAAFRACSLAERYGVPKSKSLSAIGGITRRSSEEIHAAVRLLDAVASYVYISNLATWRNEEISQTIAEYIRNNLSADLTNRAICDHFHFSRTRLYQISMGAFGMGITKYVEYCRMEKAKEMLLSGESISSIASSCGYSEYNYFCKVFKKATGVSPGEYKRKHK